MQLLVLLLVLLLLVLKCTLNLLRLHLLEGALHAPEVGAAVLHEPRHHLTLASARLQAAQGAFVAQVTHVEADKLLLHKQRAATADVVLAAMRLELRQLGCSGGRITAKLCGRGGEQRARRQEAPAALCGCHALPREVYGRGRGGGGRCSRHCRARAPLPAAGSCAGC
jgi:hypothetical protein